MKIFSNLLLLFLILCFIAYGLGLQYTSLEKPKLGVVSGRVECDYKAVAPARIWVDGVITNVDSMGHFRVCVNRPPGAELEVHTMAVGYEESHCIAVVDSNDLVISLKHE